MDMTQCQQQVSQWFDAHEAEMFSVLEKLVNLNSFSHNGADVDRVGEVIADHMTAWGFACKTLPHGPVPEDEPWMTDLGHMVTAKTHPDTDEPGIVFSGHMDTVFPAGTVKARPFTIDKATDRATGPGVLDMKSGVVLNMFAARALRELGLVDVPMTLTFSPDEELGAPNSSWQLVRQCNGARAAFCTEPGYSDGGVSVERKGSGHMLLEIKGVSAHAGRDYEKGSSAILELAHKILAYQEHLDLEHDTTVNTGIITGGTSANSVAPCASARIHITFRTLERGRELVKAIRNDTAKTWVQGTSSHVSGGIRLPPLRPTDKVMRLYHVIKEAADLVGYPCRMERSKGAAESGLCCSILDLPVVCSMGPEGTGLHSPLEYIIPSTVLPKAKVLALSALMASKTFEPSARVALD